MRTKVTFFYLCIYVSQSLADAVDYDKVPQYAGVVNYLRIRQKSTLVAGRSEKVSSSLHCRDDSS